MLKILQARFQQYVNHEFPDVQARFRKGRGTRDPIANIHWIIEKAREFQKNICFIEHTKAVDCVGHSKLWRILSITLLACEMSATVQWFEHSLALPPGKPLKITNWHFSK